MLSSRLHLPVPWQIWQINRINVAGKDQINLDSCLNMSINYICFYMHSFRLLIPDSNFVLTKPQRYQEYWSFGKTGSKNMQLVFQYCCKTPSGKAIFYHPRSYLLTTSVTHCKAGLMRVVKRATSLFNSFGSNVAKQAACFFYARFTAP